MQSAFVPAIGVSRPAASHPVEVSSRHICRRPIASSVRDDAVQGTQLLFGDRQVAQEAACIEWIDQLRERGVV